MAASTMSTLTRLTVMTSRVRVDLAVPASMSVAELSATLVSRLGRDVADEGAGGDGFVLQRAAEAPLDPALTLAACQIRDGDVLHLRPRSAQLPELAYDDVLDAVASGVLTRTARWQAAHTARACTLFASAVLAFVLITCLVTGPSWAAPAGVCGGLAALLLAAATALGRAYRRRGPALTAAGFAVAAAAGCGAFAAGGHLSFWQFGSTQLLPGAAGAVLAAVLAIALLGWGLPGFVGVIAAGVLTAIGAAVADFGDLDAAATAAATAGIALALSPAIPVAAFKFSRLPMPTIPTGAADLRADTAMVDGSAVLTLAVRADQVMTGLVAAVGAIVAGAAVVLVPHGPSERVLVGVLAAICLLRARLFTGRAQRMSMLICGGITALALLVERTAAVQQDGQRLLAFVLPAALVALLLLALVVVLPGRRYAPPTGRTADIFESLLVLSVLPLVLAVAGVYGRIRGMTS